MANNSTRTTGNDTANTIIGLCIIVFAAWLMWGIFSLLSSLFMMFILLAILALDFGNIFRKRVIIKAENRNKSLMEKLREGTIKEGGKKLDERTALGLVYFIFTIALAINALRIVFLGSHALNSKYQVAPLNVIGLAVLVLLFYNLWKAFKRIAKFAREQGTKPPEDESKKNYFFRVIVGLTEGSYIIGIFLVRFGIL